MRKINKIGIIIITFAVAHGLLWAESEKENTKNDLWKFVKAGKLTGDFRAYYMDRHFDLPQTQKSMAVGGSLKYETSSWHGLNAGLAGYTSQGFVLTDPDEDGASLLAPGQKGYTVLGQAYLQAEICRTRLRLFRQELDTPFINIYDVRMTPVTYEAYTLESHVIANLDFIASHITKIKVWADTQFNSMSEAAGFPDSNEPVTMAGLVFTPGQSYKLQLWNYYCHQFMNVVYFQADADWKLTNDLTLSGSFQAFDQQDAGKALGGNFHTGMAGIQTVIDWKGIDLTMGFTVTDKGHDIVNPWGSYPGYTSIMEEDCDLAGEKAWVFGLAYDFERIGIKGLSAFTYHTQAYIPPGGWFSHPDQRETDFTVDYRFSDKLQGLWLRLRAAFVDCSFDVGGTDYSDYRIILNYNF